MGRIKRKRGASKITVNFILRVASVSQLFESAVKDKVLARCKAKDVVSKPNQLPQIHALTEYLVSLLERFFTPWLESDELCFVRLEFIILLVNADVVQ